MTYNVNHGESVLSQRLVQEFLRRTHARGFREVPWDGALLGHVEAGIHVIWWFAPSIPSEVAVLEQDLRSVPLDAAGIIELAKDYLHSDVSYEVRADWDLWVLDAQGKWTSEPQPLEIFCRGEDYDDGFWRENGHIEVNLGFEHLFTGHAGLLGMRKSERPAAQSIEEARFLESMAWPENLQRYQEKTRENIKKLLDWVRKIERAVPVERLSLWSEGEENFEARLEEILVAH